MLSQAQAPLRERRFFRADGSPVAEADGLDPEAWYCRVDLVGGLLEVLDRNTASYYDPETGTCVFRTSLGFE